jgi:hypothetical protein
MLMYVYIVYILLFLLVVWIATSNGKEGYFTFYQGMPGIPKTFISTGFIRNPSEFTGGQTCCP